MRRARPHEVEAIDRYQAERFGGDYNNTQSFENDRRAGEWHNTCPVCGDLMKITPGADEPFECRASCSPNEMWAVLAAAETVREQPGDKFSQGSAADSRLDMVFASTVKPRKIRYAFARRLPIGTVSLLAGEGGLGKSSLLALLTAQATRGELEGDLYGQPATVLVASAEDAVAEVLVPRLMAAGADLTKVAFIGIGNGINLPDDVDRIAERAQETDARIITIDPLVAFIPSSSNTYRDQDVRRVIAPLSRLAEEQELTMVTVLHLNKSESSSALSRIGGSVGFKNAARSVLIVGRDPEDPDGERGHRRVIAHAKSNYGAEAPSLLMRIEGREIQTEDGETIPTSRVVLMGETAVEADDLVRHQTPDERSASDEAAEFLRDMLAEGPAQATLVKVAADENGISTTTLNRVKRRIGVRSTRPGGKGPWLWELDELPTQVVNG